MQFGFETDADRNEFVQQLEQSGGTIRSRILVPQHFGTETISCGLLESEDLRVVEKLYSEFHEKKKARKQNPPQQE